MWDVSKSVLTSELIIIAELSKRINLAIWIACFYFGTKDLQSFADIVMRGKEITKFFCLLRFELSYFVHLFIDYYVALAFLQRADGYFDI